MSKKVELKIILDTDGDAEREWEGSFKSFVNDSPTEAVIEETTSGSASYPSNECGRRTPAVLSEGNNISKTEVRLDEISDKAKIDENKMATHDGNPMEEVFSNTDGDAEREWEDSFGSFVPESRTETMIEEQSCNSVSYPSGECGRRTPGRVSERDSISKTETKLDESSDRGIIIKNKMVTAESLKTESDGFSTPEAGYKGIRTARPISLSPDESRTECFLAPNDEWFDDVSFSHVIAPMEPDQEDTTNWNELLQYIYERMWRERNVVVKCIIVIWFCFSTLLIIKLICDTINTYWLISFDDCHSVHAICQRFGVACFTKCGVSRWDVFWYRILGD